MDCNAGKQLAVVNFLTQVATEGCSALGYRLTGGYPLEKICVKHLVATLRVAVSFDAIDHVWILLIGHHDSLNPSRDIYATLYRMAEVEVPSAARTKPACCEPDGLPPMHDQAELLADKMLMLRRTRRK